MRREYGSPVAALKAKRFEYAATIDRDGRLAAAEGPPVELGSEWTPEHLLLVALVDCSLTSLRYHARRAGIAVAGSGSAAGVITKRESDERYAFIEIDVDMEVSLDPPLPPDEREALLAKAERDCFIAASLTVKPSYVWRVAG
jgi:organic hydroperoxide reductase OsmC/OhrA